MLHIARLLLLLLLTYQLAQATVAPVFLPREEAPTICVDGSAKRTLFNIIWGCVSTTFICAWTAIHPNIPPRESALKRVLRRLELMFWTIVAPEILPCWALNQLLAAMTIRDVYNEGKGYKEEPTGLMKRWFSLFELPAGKSRAWTLKHGHFLIMGGFHLVEPVEGNTSETVADTDTKQVGAASDVANVQPTSTPILEGTTDTNAEKGLAPSGNQFEPEEGRVTILSLEMLRELVKDPEFKIRITEDAITDRSKGNALSKLIFILQTTWFITQCIARSFQGLPITQLELTTLALASLNGITFVLWWDKPLGVQSPVYVYMKRKLTDAERDVVTERGVSTRSDLIATFDFKDLLTSVCGVVHCRSEKNIFLSLINLITLPLELILIGPFFLILVFGSSFFGTIVDLVMFTEESTSFSADATHVPTYYVPKHRYSSSFHICLLLILGSVFGAIHCAGWNFSFPIYAEKILWRAASLAVTIIPIGVTATFLIIEFVTGTADEATSESDPDYVAAFEGIVVLMIPIIIYAAARLVLLGQALALLRNLPPGAFVVVDWTKLYPHVL